MSSGLHWRATSRSAKATEAIGAEIGSKLKGGEVIELISDLGGGKTTFVRGLISGLGITSQVPSPTFTISRQYQTGPLTLYHFDFYRLHAPGIIANELSEVVGGPLAIVVVEWPEIVNSVLPALRLEVEFKITGEASRELLFSYHKALRYLVPKEN